MRKYSSITGSIVVFLALFSCIEDNGNYTYQSASGMYPANVIWEDQNYEILAGETLVITPDFERKVDDSDYEYLWFTIYPSGGKTDILGYEKNLNYPVLLKPGAYNLYLKVKNKVRGTSVFYRASLKVITEFSQGWFLTKEQSDGTTDMDFFKYDGKILSDILAMTNDKGVPGKPVKTTFAYTAYGIFNDATNKIEAQPVFIVATESDIWSLRGNDFSLHFDTKKMFMEIPGKIEPYDIGTYTGGSLNTTILINAGEFHWMPSGTTPTVTPTNDGKYTESLFPSVDINKYVCKIFVYPIHFIAPGILLFFDNKTNSFKKVEANMFVTLVTLRNFSGISSIAGIPDCNNMPYDLVYMKEYSSVQGLGIMRSKSDGKFYGFKTVNLTPAAVANPFDAFVPVPDNANVATAAIRCVNKTNATIYSSSGDNKVFAYKIGGQGDAGGTETQILTLESDEKITYLEDIRYEASGGGANFKHLVVLTSQGDNWNMYCYNFIGASDEIDRNPVKKYSGKGKAAHVLYRGLTGDPCF